MNNALLSVIMPVYNAERYIFKAIKSILNQTYKNLELIIIEDGSTDQSLKIIESINDERVRLNKNDRNRGIVYSRNKGLSLAKGDYVGMFDADDIAFREKFEEQINFLEKNKDFGMIGSWAKWIDENDKKLPGGWRLKSSPEKIPSIMLFKNYFLQSAVLYRKESISNYTFREGYDILEDYLIWLEITADHKTWNLQKHLVYYRVHSKGVTKRQKEKKEKREKKVFEMELKKFGLNPTEKELALHILIRNDDSIKEISTLSEINNWLLKIIIQNKKVGKYNHKMLIRVVFDRWVKVCYKAKKLHILMLGRFIFSKLNFLYLKSFIYFAKTDRDN